jgi:N-methylhydantoinase A/oxoprolinase/acetone carboxylase beta subunit
MIGSRHSEQLRLGIDIGGTFTDFALCDRRGRLLTTQKVPTERIDPWLSIRTGLRALRAEGVDLGAITDVLHGTTLVINTLIERRGARVGLLTNRGFADVLYLQRENRYDIYDPDLVLPEPLVASGDRRELSGRVSGSGEILEPLDRDEAERVVRELVTADVESLAVCLLHSYQVPAHELELREIIERVAPSHPVSLSHEVLPQIREYERCSATVINAYVQPLVHGYLERVRHGLAEEGCPAKLFVMTSSGGMITAEAAMRWPIQLTESGPAAGVFAAGLLGSTVTQDDILSFDMGGTTAKSCVVRDGRAVISRDYEVARIRRFKPGSGLPLRIPVVDLLEIGAGGGSIAEVSPLGLVQVGPRSAGADPGPVCYGLGGDEPTVTDADLLLGFIAADSFLQGDMPLDSSAAARALEQRVAEPLGISVMEAAEAVHRVATETMAESARIHAAEMNVDVRACAMVAFGGAGPVHAFAVARSLGIGRIICPLHASVFSVVGLLASPFAFEATRSWVTALDDADLETVEALLHRLEASSRAVVRQSGAESAVVERSVDMSYVGQGFEVTVPLPDGALGTDAPQELKLLFDRSYRAAYGRGLEQLPARCITWRARAAGPPPPLDLTDRPVGNGRGDGAPRRRTVRFPLEGDHDCQVVPLDALRPDLRLEGPVLVETGLTTVVVPAGAATTLDASGCLIVDL